MPIPLLKEFHSGTQDLISHLRRSQQVLPTMFSALMHLEGSDEELIMLKLK